MNVQCVRKTFPYLALCAALVTAQLASAADATTNLPFTGGTGFSGTIAGTITADVKQSGGGNDTMAFLDVTDLDIDLINDGGFLNGFPDGDARNRTAFADIDIADTVITISLPSTNFSSTISGSANVTAGDNLTDTALGVLGGLVPGSDGAWDDPNSTGILNNATFDGFTATLDNNISAPVNVSGSLSAGLVNDVVIPDVVTGLLNVDLRVKNTSSVAVNFDPVQNIEIQSLSLTSSQPISLNAPGSNFVEASHPVGMPVLDLTAGGFDFAASTIISGVLNADLTGQVIGSLNTRADISVIGIDLSQDIDPFDVDSGTGVELFAIDEAISLPDVELPFAIQVLHEPTSDVDFDDVLAGLLSGTGGLEIPLTLLEENVLLEIPEVDFELGTNGPSGMGGGGGTNAFQVYVDAGLGQHGYVELEHVAATFGGQVVLDLAADLTISADLLAEAFKSDAINIPEPAATLLGDISGDGQVDIGDFTLWGDAFGETGAGLPADLSNDGEVDIGDFTIWGDHFGETAGPGGGGSGVSAVPEPGSFVLLAVASVILLLNRHRWRRRG